MLTFHKLSAEVERGDGVEFRVTVEAAMSSDPGKWEITVENLDTGKERELQFTNVTTLKEALSVGLLLI